MEAAGDDAAQLRSYISAKQQVVECVQAAKRLLQREGREPGAEPCQELLARLAEDRFQLAVVGQFKRGKSSLMNAIVGADLLPTGAMPLTSVITALCYGPRARAVLRRQGWGLDQEIRLDELADYITERGNPGNEKGLLEARIELPVRFLRRGLHFIDTPGVGSSRQENTATTYQFLPHADALILVTSAEAPLGETEGEFLRDIGTSVRKLFVVVNKMDLLGADERVELLQYVKTEIERALGTDDFRLYPVSARLGLAAKLRQDVASLRESGLLELEEALSVFLADERGRTFLIAILDQAQRLLASQRDPVSAPASGEIAQTEELDRLNQTVAALRSALLAGTPLAEVRAVAIPSATGAEGEILEQAVVTSRSKRTRAGELASFPNGTCPICAALRQAMFDFFAHWQYELTTSEAARRAFAETGGFCAAHTWQFERIASPVGISQGFAPLVDAEVALLSASLDQPLEDAAAHLEMALSIPEKCPACRLSHQAETEQVERFLVALAALDVRARYAVAEGLCLPHLHAALAMSQAGETAAFLLREQIRCLTEIAEDMRSYTLKREAVRRGLLNSQEERAWRRALLHLVGESGVRARGEPGI